MVELTEEEIINLQESKNELQEHSPSLALYNQSNELTSKIINEDDPDKIEDLTKLFTLNQKKKEIARVNKLSKLLDMVDDEVILRFTEYPETFNNDQLLKYMTSTQQAITLSEQSINQVPQIQINNHKNEINISDSGLSRESRKKVLDTVMSILNNAKNDVIDVDIKDEGEE